MQHVYDVLKNSKTVTDSVIVGFSGGKDSIVVLDLCVKHFKKVEAYFLYIVKGLGFQERYLNYIERKYKILFHRLPHFVLSDIFKHSAYRPNTNITTNCSKIKITDIENEMRSRVNIDWFATGQKACDSIDRNAMIRRCNGIDHKARRIYPIAYFNNAAVFNYLKANKIPLPPDYGLFSGSKNQSFGGLYGQDLKAIKDKYPEDYEKILEVFPFVEASVKRYEFSSN